MKADRWVVYVRTPDREQPFENPPAGIARPRDQAELIARGAAELAERAGWNLTYAVKELEP